MYSFEGAFYYIGFEIKEDKICFAFFFYFFSVFLFFSIISYIVFIISSLFSSFFPYLEIRKSILIHFFIDNFTNRRKITNTICFQGYE